MSTTRVMVFATVVMGVASWGCKRLNVSLNYHEPRPVVYTHVDAGHVCSHGCRDHYYNGSEIVVLRRHRHEYGCGHYWNGTYWLTAASTEHIRDVHVCDRHCHNHFWNGSRLVALGDGHRHNAHCGHHWDGHYWVVLHTPRHYADEHVRVDPRVAVTTTHHHGPACGCVYNRAGSKWVIVSAGHIHGYDCGHVLYEGRWSITVKSPHHKKRDKIHPKRVKRRR